MANNVLIAGAGQLGSRHLQGLALYSEPVNIWVFDISTGALNKARERWSECGEQAHKVEYVRDLSSIPKRLDTVFIATNADIRLDIVSKIASVAKVRYWVLEKVLSQRSVDLHRLKLAVRESKGAWVNTPMYMWPLYTNLRACSDVAQPVEASFTGFRGVACNAIHYIDFVSRWGGSRVSRVNLSGLNPRWVMSKREGFMEVEGSLEVYFTDGSKLFLEGSERASEYKVEIKTSEKIWQINEAAGIALSGVNDKIEAPVLYQSELTGPLLHHILDSGKCELPELDESIEQHEPLLSALLGHWNAHMSKKADHVPIT